MLLADLLSHDPSLRLVHGNGDADVARLTTVDFLAPGALAFAKNQKFLAQLEARLAAVPGPSGALVVDQAQWDKLSPDRRLALTDRLTAVASGGNVALSLALLSRPMHAEKFRGFQSAVDGRQLGNADVHPSAVVAQGAFIGEHASVGAGAVLHPGVVVHPHAHVGEGSELFSNVVVYPFTKIGARVRVHANTTLGSDGYGYVFHKGQHVKIWHMGGVEIHDDVEIGSNSSVDMGTFTPTVIGAGTRIDNQVQVAHNVRIGRGCILCGQSGVAGSAVLEDFVVLGGRAAVGPDAHIGQGTQIAGAAMVNEGAVWPAGSVLGGHPARDLKEWMRTFAWVRKNALKGQEAK